MRSRTGSEWAPSRCRTVLYGLRGVGYGRRPFVLPSSKGSDGCRVGFDHVVDLILKQRSDLCLNIQSRIFPPFFDFILRVFENPLQSSITKPDTAPTNPPAGHGCNGSWSRGSSGRASL